MRRISTAQKKRTRMTLNVADRKYATKIGNEIRSEGGSKELWDASELTPAINAAVNQIVAHGKIGKCKCHGHGAADSLEQFYRYGEITHDRPKGMSRGGLVWVRPARRVKSRRR